MPTKRGRRKVVDRTHEDPHAAAARLLGKEHKEGAYAVLLDREDGSSPERLLGYVTSKDANRVAKALSGLYWDWSFVAQLMD